MSRKECIIKLKYTEEAIKKRNYITNIIVQILKKLLFIVLILLIYNSLLITKSALGTGGAKDIFGYQAYIITTESMKPTIKVGDVVIIENCNENELKEGDIITVQTNAGINTHRIVEITTKADTGETEYITKGDNNNVEDPEAISYNQIEGKKVIIIPFLGTLLLALENKAYILILTIFIAAIAIYVINLQKKKKRRREKKKDEDKKAKNIPQNN
ncbi:MAG: signal peptidase I [Oscillospiraceae bacterium]|nr:signal peptidase I [Oscillospiraceae bacterium]